MRLPQGSAIPAVFSFGAVAAPWGKSWSLSSEFKFSLGIDHAASLLQVWKQLKAVEGCVCVVLWGVCIGWEN